MQALGFLMYLQCTSLYFLFFFFADQGEIGLQKLLEFPYVSVVSNY